MAATSVSRTATLELALTRSKYFPRLSFPKSDRLYSTRSSSDVDLTFFINSPFMLGCDAGVDDPDCLTTHGVGYD